MFYRPQALHRLARLPNDVIVPAVVFTERARQLSKQGIEPAAFAQRLADNAFAIEPYGREQAARYAPAIHDDGDWQRLARDAMIAGHVEDTSVLWTTNPAGFRELGLSDAALMAV